MIEEDDYVFPLSSKADQALSDEDVDELRKQAKEELAKETLDYLESLPFRPCGINW